MTNNLCGINLPPTAYYKAPVFANIVKQATGHSTINSKGGNFEFINGGGVHTNVDANGEPNSDADLYLGEKSYENHGTYAISYTGNGTVSVVSGGTITSQSYNSTLNKTTATLVIASTDSAHLKLRFTGTSAGVKNLKIMRPTFPGSTTSYPENTLFVPEFVNYIARFQGFRTLDFMGSNSNGQRFWSERVPPNWFTQSNFPATFTSEWAGPGVAWEYVILLANAVKAVNPNFKAIWVNIPVLADNKYVRNLIRLFETGNAAVNCPPLASGIEVRLEYGNENPWNDSSAFQQSFWTQDMAEGETSLAVPDIDSPQSLGLNYDGNADNYNLGCRRVGSRSMDYCRIVEEELGYEALGTRYFVAIQWAQRNGNDTARRVLDYLDDAGYHKYASAMVLGGSAYYNPNQSDPNMTIDNIWSSNTMDVNTWANEWLVNDFHWVAGYGYPTGDIPWDSYEGGTSFDPSWGPNDAIMTQANTDSRITNCIIDHHNKRSEYGGRWIFYFYANGAGPTYFPWNFVDSFYSPNTPKTQATDQLQTQARVAPTQPARFVSQSVGLTMDGAGISIYKGWGLPTSGAYRLDPKERISYTFRVTEAGFYKVSLKTQQALNYNMFLGSVPLVNGGVISAATSTVPGNGVTNQWANPVVIYCENPGIYSIRINSNTTSQVWFDGLDVQPNVGAGAIDVFYGKFPNVPVNQHGRLYKAIYKTASIRYPALGSVITCITTFLNYISAWLPKESAFSDVAATIPSTLNGQVASVKGWGKQNLIVTQSTTANMPTLSSEGIKFVGANSQFLQYNGSFMHGINSFGQIVIGKRESNTKNMFFGGNSTSTDQNLHLGYLSDTTLRYSSTGYNVDSTVESFRGVTEPFRSFSGSYGGAWATMQLNQNAITLKSVSGGLSVSGYNTAYVGRHLNDYLTGTVTDVVLCSTGAVASTLIAIELLVRNFRSQDTKVDKPDILAYKLPNVPAIKRNLIYEAIDETSHFTGVSRANIISTLSRAEIFYSADTESCFTNDAGTTKAVAGNRVAMVRNWGKTSTRNAIQTVNLDRPIFRADGLEFLRSDSRFLNYDASFLNGVNYTVIARQRRRASQTNNHFLGGEIFTANQQFYLGYTNNTGRFGNLSTNLDRTLPTYVTGEGFWITDAQQTNSGRSLSFNRGALTSDSSSTLLTGLTTNYIGRMRNTSTTYSDFSGVVSDILIWNSPLTYVERLVVDEFLQSYRRGATPYDPLGTWLPNVPSYRRLKVYRAAFKTIVDNGYDWFSFMDALNSVNAWWQVDRLSCEVKSGTNFIKPKNNKAGESEIERIKSWGTSSQMPTQTTQGNKPIFNGGSNLYFNGSLAHFMNYPSTILQNQYYTVYVKFARDTAVAGYVLGSDSTTPPTITTDNFICGFQNNTTFWNANTGSALSTTTSDTSTLRTWLSSLSPSGRRIEREGVQVATDTYNTLIPTHRQPFIGRHIGTTGTNVYLTGTVASIMIFTGNPSVKNGMENAVSRFMMNYNG